LLWVAGVETSGSVGRRLARIALVAQMGQGQGHGNLVPIILDRGRGAHMTGVARPPGRVRRGAGRRIAGGVLSLRQWTDDLDFSLPAPSEAAAWRERGA